MVAIKVRVKAAEGELWVVPLAHLVWVRWVKLKEGAVLYLHFDDGFRLEAPDPDGALLDEITKALEIPNGVSAIGGLWDYSRWSK